jgi:hypothetical protein
MEKNDGGFYKSPKHAPAAYNNTSKVLQEFAGTHPITVIQGSDQAYAWKRPWEPSFVFRLGLGLGLGLGLTNRKNHRR